MDFEEELRKFARSEVAMRQMRESAHWCVDIVSGDRCLRGDARDLSKGGLGAAVVPDQFWQDHLTIGLTVFLCFHLDAEDAPPVERISARIIWLRKSDTVWEIGFEFFDLSDDASLQIDRYLLARIVTRHLEDDEDV